MYQSEYARVFLRNAGSQHILPLSDYIDHNLIIKNIDMPSKRINQVLYNPIKGLEITTHLIRLFPQIKWIPIIKLKSEEVSKLLASSKVYVDFGSHPGKDRIPREAVLNGCCIIVNKQGAAANSLDMDIPAEFKIEDPIKEQNQIVSLINKCFNFYDDQYSKFGNYLSKIISEEEDFEKEIKELIKHI
ncbi:MAG: hypothetical protein EOP43_02500 [Sphingobacteriaceae bacterium]|nr:MAG: hypothetical protein EOP43_02500 [Sphingobacteriaceae bacterium]